MQVLGCQKHLERIKVRQGKTELDVSEYPAIIRFIM